MPLAFAKALEACRFEAGDMFYSDRAAYGRNWGEALRSLAYSVQVLYPPRKVSSIERDEGSFFESNWQSEVRLECWDHTTSEAMRIVTRQGNLYTALWKGDIAALASDCPQPPLRAGELQSRLPECLEVIEAAQTDDSRTLFVLANDLSSPLLRGKVARLKEAFGFVEYTGIRPSELHELRGAEFAPTLEICVFALDLDVQKVKERVKRALYVPLKNKITDREAFYAEKHGIVVERTFVESRSRGRVSEVVRDLPEVALGAAHSSGHQLDFSMIDEQLRASEGQSGRFEAGEPDGGARTLV